MNKRLDWLTAREAIRSYLEARYGYDAGYLESYKHPLYEAVSSHIKELLCGFCQGKCKNNHYISQSSEGY